MVNPETNALDLNAALERLKRYHPKDMDLSLDRVKRLLKDLGNPEQRMPPTIHVAGTNGKGSTIAFMRAILEAAGLRVHVYTSPHLVIFNERIRVAGALIDDAALLSLIEEIEAINKDEPITFFEFTTALAFLAFSRCPADALLLETGLGGVLDATNVIDNPAATVITRISYDHIHILGTTLEEIAGEKAGILKRGAPCILSWQRSHEAVRVITARAEALNVSLHEFGRDWRIKGDKRDLHYQDTLGNLDLPLPGLYGPHQHVNAGAAIAALRYAGMFALSPQNFADGVANAEWHGRLQRLTKGPLPVLLPYGWELWLDGGHNDSGGEVLAAQATLWNDLPLSLVVGMINTKNPEAFLKPLVPHVALLRSVSIVGNELSLAAEETARTAIKAGIAAQPMESIEAALKDIIATAAKPGRILICGSLYLAGNVLAESQ